MSKSAHLYVHPASVGDVDACVAVRADLVSLLKTLHANNDIRGYWYAVVADEETAEDEFLRHMFDYEVATNGRFPFVYCQVQPHEIEKVDIDDIMRTRGFERHV